MPKTTQQNERIRRTRSGEILDAGLELFALQGFERTTIEQIARKAGISKGLIYSYYKSKDDLLKSIFVRVSSEISFQLDTDHDGEISDNGLQHFLDTLFEQVKNNPAFWRFFTVVSLQPSVSSLLNEELVKLSQPVVHLFNRYFARKGFEDPYGEMAVFGAMLSGAVLKYVSAPEYFPLDTVKRRMIEMYP